MKLEEDIQNLTAQEKKILLALSEKKEARVEEIEKETGLGQSAVMRSGLNLKENGFVEIIEETVHKICLSNEGKNYYNDQLPEKKLLKSLCSEGSLKLDEVSETSDLPGEKIGISIGWVKKKGWAEIEERNGKKFLKVTESGKKALEEKDEDEELLEEFSEGKRVKLDQISQSKAEGIERLRSRELIETEEITNRKLVLTDKGMKALDLGIEVEERVSRLTSDIIRSGEWKNKKLKKYNVTASGPSTHPGKEHPQRRTIEELRSTLLRMGFEEIKGPIVESEFWNFDVLFQAQNHPAREIHDTLSLSKPGKADILNEDLLKRVKKAHEEGVAGSEGWGYDFDEEISHRPILRSQTTADTVRYLSERPEPPVKVFCIDKVFRRERIDYQHLAEFPQAEGIVMAPNLNFRHMLGYLKQILVEMGVPKIRFRPGYFPYTEPSAEADGYFPERDEWIELLGAGMFRPELLEPLGIEHPVLAWGIGFSRIAMIRMGIEDMRDLHNNDLEWLKEQTLR